MQWGRGCIDTLGFLIYINATGLGARSSVAERAAHNRLVPGSNPGEPTIKVIFMSCYFRHLKGIFDEAGIQVIPSTKKQIDRAIHQLVGTDYKDCPATWQKLKQQIMTDEEKRQEFIIKLKDAIS